MLRIDDRAKTRRTARPKGTRTPLARAEARNFYLFLSPWLIGLVVFTGGPILASVGISFTDWSLLSDPSFIGFDNYTRMFTDELLLSSVWVTLYFGVGATLASVAATFFIAILLNQKVRGVGIFRAIFYIPAVVAGVGTALLWTNLLHPDYGLVNLVLGWAGIQGPGWLTSTSWAIPGLIIMSVWGAGNTVVIYLAALQNVSVTLYEAATIDGAGWWGRTWHVTIPMMSPVIFFNMITGFIGSLQAYALILIMTDGGPENSTMVLGLYIYRQAFNYFDLGYASALSVGLFALILVITAIQFAAARRWVHYEAK
ncbi:carbohydrate ABC transporter permease [Jiangella muralis]|uniref:carbohydrate ABC transporter permease n=1 Tax=Jiangella muralis TaxID=702383 RepID=UPI00069EA97A|nr:sugar ABC transporter permease [Jiangella muralis]